MYKILICLLAYSQLSFATKVDLSQMNMTEVAEQALQAALNDQVKSTSDKYYIPGEWTTQIVSSPIPYIAGVGKMFGKDEEASAFTTASVINILAQTYLDYPRYRDSSVIQKIPAAIRRGVETFDRYKDGATYNFYPALVAKKGVVVRRPIGLRMLPIWHGFTNVPNDADTSSVTFSALLLNAKVNNEAYSVPEEAFSEFIKYRDIDRKSQYYNKREGQVHTGAFLTWLYDEKNPNMPRFYLAPSESGERIPFNRNDVDCVVNTNVMKLRALAKRSELPGYKDTCQMITEIIAKDKHDRCGIYYPNTMNLSFVLALSEKAGDRCLQDNSREKIVTKILGMQREDGSWLNDNNIHPDPVITTAFAMYSLQHFANINDPQIATALVYGTKYLLSKTLMKNDQMYWQADNFFTATAFIRSLMMWKSKAYTNAIVGSVLLKMSVTNPQMTPEDYLSVEIDSSKLKPLEFINDK